MSAEFALIFIAEYGMIISFLLYYFINVSKLHSWLLIDIEYTLDYW